MCGISWRWAPALICTALLVRRPFSFLRWSRTAYMYRILSRPTETRVHFACWTLEILRVTDVRQTFRAPPQEQPKYSHIALGLIYYSQTRSTRFIALLLYLRAISNGTAGKNVLTEFHVSVKACGCRQTMKHSSVPKRGARPRLSRCRTLLASWPSTQSYTVLRSRNRTGVR